MSEQQTVPVYKMNPVEDRFVFGDELENGMLVLREDHLMRQPHGSSEDQQIRAQRFRRVTRLRREEKRVVFIGEWIDGYQEVHECPLSWAWLVKKDASEQEDGELT